MGFLSDFFNAVKHIIVLAVYLPVTGFCVFRAITSIQASLDRGRGTNAASRFVRDVKANSIFRSALWWGFVQIIVSIPCMLVLGFSLFTLLMALPGVILTVYSIVQQNKSNKDKQRVKDARVVTKTATKVAGATAVGAGVVTATALTGGLGAPAALAVGGAVTGAARAASKAGDMMSDVDAPDITESDFKEFNQAAKSLGETYGISVDEAGNFIARANAIGVKGATVKEVGESALKSPVMQTLLAEAELEPTVENVIPFVQRALAAVR